jgi:hypothetical protein
MFRGEYDMLWGLDPAAEFVEAGGGANGADDGVAGARGSACVLDDEIESGVIFDATALRKARGSGVAPDSGRGDIEFKGGVKDANPVNEIVVDGLAVRVVTDGAFAGVMGGFGLIWRRRGGNIALAREPLERAGVAAARLAGWGFGGF